MHSRHFSLQKEIFIAPRPKPLNIPKQTYHLSNKSLEEPTPHFKNEYIAVKSFSSHTNFRSEIPKPPKYLPSLRPLMHSPKAPGNFVFKEQRLPQEDIAATFRVVIRHK